MIGRPELSRLATAAGVGERAQEKDYVLAWLVAARAIVGPATFVFKGGTALRRCWFPGYRYSEDLDFTADDSPTDDRIAAAIDGWCEWVADEAGIQASRIVGGTEGATFYVQYVGPLRAADGRQIKIDVATDEAVRDGSERRLLLSEYSDLDGAKYAVDVYALEEVWAEKVRSLLQRSEPRDLYDVHQLLEHDRSLADLGHGLFERKAISKGRAPGELIDRLTSRRTTFERTWETRLATQVRDLPAFDGVWRRVLAGLRRADY